MPLTAPDLDDRTYSDIVAEAKALIPRYAPEWTNHNESDPGIALLELFGWMTDIMLYRLNRVPDRNYIAFLQLLGIELRPGRPAKTELTFTLSPTLTDPEVIVPRGTQVAASEPNPNGDTIIFETDEALVAMEAKLAEIQVNDGFSYSIETTKNGAAEQTLYPFGFYAREGSALYLGFDSPLDEFTNEQVNLALAIYEAAQEHRACSLDLAQLPLPADVVWEYTPDGQRWFPVRLDKDETQAFALSGHVYFRVPDSPEERAIKKNQIGKVEKELFWIRCRLDRSYYEASPQIERVLINTVKATQAITVRDEVLGGSDGRPNQSFTLANASVIPLAEDIVIGADNKPVTIRNLQLEVSETPIAGDALGFRVWEEVDDFYDSDGDDPHYVLNRTIGEIKFGDGTNGRIPVANIDLPSTNVVARHYRYGGGSFGNVGAETITELQTFVPYINGVTNLYPAADGDDEQEVSAAKKDAAQVLKSRQRAVTTEDFEFFATLTPGVRVRRAKALPLAHPQFAGVQAPGVVTVIVIPDTDDPKPLPGPRTLRAVCKCLNEVRLVTTEVFVVPPTYREVRIETSIIAQPQADLATVKQAVEENLVRFFHPLRGGEDGLGWEFGYTIFYSQVYRIIIQTDGVDRIDNNDLTIYLDGRRQEFCRDVPINRGELLFSGEHEIGVNYER